MPTLRSQSMALPGGFAAQRGVRLDSFDDLLPNLHHRVQAGGRLLEDHADAPAAHGAHARFGQAQYVGVIQLDAAVGDLPVLRQQPHQRQCRHALAAAGLAHQGKGLAAADGQPGRRWHGRCLYRRRVPP
jgi:hypothetical protein